MFKKLNKLTNLSIKIINLLYVIFVIAGIYLLILILDYFNIFSLINLILKALSPLFIGIIIAWLLNPIVNWLETKKIKRGIGTSLIYLIIIANIYLLFSLLIPNFTKQLNDFLAIIPELINTVDNAINSLLSHFRSNIDVDQVKTSITEGFINQYQRTTNNLPNILIDGAISVIGIVFTIIMGLVISFYLLYNNNGNTRIYLKIIPKRYRNDLRILLKSINTELSNYIRGLIIIQIILFLMYALIYWFIGHDAFILLALIGAITDIIPFIGPYIGGAIATIVGFTISPTVGYKTIIVTIITPTADSLILEAIKYALLTA